MTREDQLAAYMEQLAHQSALYVGAVQDLGPEAARVEYDRALIIEAPHGVDPAEAFAIVLAAQIDQDAADRFGWLFPGGRSDNATTGPRSLRARIEAVCAGTVPLLDLPRPDRLYAVELLRQRGYSIRDSAKVAGVSHQTIERYRARYRDANPSSDVLATEVA